MGAIRQTSHNPLQFYNHSPTSYRYFSQQSRPWWQETDCFVGWRNGRNMHNTKMLAKSTAGEWNAMHRTVCNSCRKVFTETRGTQTEKASVKMLLLPPLPSQNWQAVNNGQLFLSLTHTRQKVCYLLGGEKEWEEWREKEGGRQFFHIGQFYISNQPVL